MNNLPSLLHRFVLLCAICQIALVAIALTIKFWAWDFDDGFIVYRYVENILTGAGWVYNPGQKYNASTSVLNTVLILLGALFTKDPQISAHIIGGLALFLIGSSAFYIFQRHAPLWLSCFWATVIVFLMGNNFTWGLESNLFYGALLCFIALDLYGVTSWLLLGLLVLIRPDALILVGLCVIRGIWRSERWVRGLLIVGSVLLPWVVFSIVQFGQVFPATLSQKVWQGSSGFWGTGPIFLKGLFNYIRGDAFTHITGVYWAPVVLVAPLVLLPQGLLYFRRGSLSSVALMVISVFSVVLAYSILNVPNYHWYYTGFLLVTYVVAFFGILEAHGAWLSKLSLLDVPGILITLAVSLWYVCTMKVDFFDVRTDVYKQLSAKINAIASPDATVAAVEVGVVGYQTKKKIIDIVGLTTPYGEFITGDNSKKLFDELRPEVIILHLPLMPHEQAVFSDPRFTLNYQQKDLVAMQGYSQLVLFVRVPERAMASNLELAEVASQGVVTDTHGARNFTGGDPWIEFKLDAQVEVGSPVFVLNYDLIAQPERLGQGSVFGRVYYAGAGEAFIEERAVPVLLALGATQRAIVSLALPGLDSLRPRRIEKLRFDPVQDLSQISVDHFRIKNIQVASLKP